MPTSRVIAGCYPPPGTSEIADAIRERRGELVGLDGALLHIPQVAYGWNLIGVGIRNKGRLRDDIRELMILRVAALTDAAFEWMQHEHLGRKAGLTTTQLLVIRDASILPRESPNADVFDALQLSALAFAQESTTTIKVSEDTATALKANLNDDEDLLVEAAAVVAIYNMVSRFLVSMDVDGMSDEVAPWPADIQEYKVPIPDSPEHYLYVETHTVSSNAPWLVFCNSILTDTTLWSFLLPHILAPPRSYNILLYDQRGHGKSSASSTPTDTVSLLTQDITRILEFLSIPNVHAVIGVADGGIVALSFATQFPDISKNIVVCGTPLKPISNESTSFIDIVKDKGMKGVADVVVPRWFPSGSQLSKPREEVMQAMVEGMRTQEFMSGVNALTGYDLSGSVAACSTRLMLLAGGLADSEDVVNELSTVVLKQQHQDSVYLQTILDAGHLPMVDATEAFWTVLKDFLGVSPG
ncbi:alpha/beta-hydrolase [Hymenopellis radicata]|nr:alpha/beta-hydrolase [Hymenopellis radicata]